jgi:hypothetical protein
MEWGLGMQNCSRECKGLRLYFWMDEINFVEILDQREERINKNNKCGNLFYLDLELNFLFSCEAKQQQVS